GYVGAPPDQPAGADKAAAAVPARSREDRDPPAGDLAAEHRAREPREVRTGVLHHPGQGQTELHRDAVDIAHLTAADPRDRASGAALNHPSWAPNARTRSHQNWLAAIGKSGTRSMLTILSASDGRG